MTRDGTLRIIRMMADVYPTFAKRFEDKPRDEKSEMVDAWTYMLDGYADEDIALALKTYITTSSNKYEPSISELIAMVHKPKEAAKLNEMAAWDIVRRAIHRGNYYADEDYENFPRLIKDVVGSPSQIRMWARDENYNEAVISSNFMRAYRSVVARENEYERMPIEARDKMDALAVQSLIGIGANENGKKNN